jgi:glucosyl-dolichyl phosphate glucuronosyltransferase
LTTTSPSPVAGLRISVVICAYTDRRWGDIVAAVASVRAQTRPAARAILVVDHHPPLLERARVAFPDLQVVPNLGRRGLSGARNTGVAHAIGDVVAFLDDDARAEPDWLERLAAGYSNPSVVGVGGAATPVWPGQRPRWLPPEFDWVVGCSFVGLPDASTPVRNLIGANMSFRREVFGSVGGFTDGIGRVGSRPLGCEETELGIRLRQWRPEARLVYEPAAVVRHRVTPDRMAWRYFCSRCYAEGLSKAMVSRRVGARDALETERRYVRSVLPRAIVRELDPRRHDRYARLASAGAILAGLGLAAAGYARGRLALRSARQGDAG